MIIKPLILSTFFIISSIGLTACGFQLRGYNSTLSQHIQPTQLIFGNSLADYAVKNSLKNQLNQLGVKHTEAKDPKTSQQPSITVSNIRTQSYQLRGILTEIRLVMSADVTYQVLKQGQLVDKTQNIQVQHSYQYDQATVSTDNPQAGQIEKWLYDSLAQRIADQFVALNLPQTSP